MANKEYVRTYDMGRVIAWLQSRGATIPQIAETCDIDARYLASMLHRYRHGDTQARTDAAIARRLLRLKTEPIAYAGRAHASDAEMRAFRNTVTMLTDAGMTYAHIASETGLNRTTIRRGMTETLTCASTRKLLSAREDLVFDMRNGFGRNRSQNRYTIADRADSCKRTVEVRRERDAQTIRTWLEAHPRASRTKCAHALGWSAKKVIDIDDRYHLFDERDKKRPIDDEMVARYVALKESDPSRTDKSIARELGISQKSTTKIRRMLADTPRHADMS